MGSKQTFQKSLSIKGLLIAATFSVGCVMVAAINVCNAEEETPFTLTSPAFTNGDAIPVKYTCEGENVSPPLKWKGVPENARSLVLILDDPDAPDPDDPKMTWVHWVLYNISPDTTSLSEGASSDNLPPGAEEGLNGWQKTSYGGPCPPIGRHRYFHKLYALDTVLQDLNKPTKSRIEAAMKGHIIKKTELVGTYKKAR